MPPLKCNISTFDPVFVACANRWARLALCRYA